MQISKTITTAYIVSITIIAAIVLYTKSNNSNFEDIASDIKIVEINVSIPTTSLVDVSRVDLTQNIMKHYPKVSKRAKQEIINTVFEESAKYSINPLILYSLLHVESSMRPWIRHSTVTVVVHGKKVTTNAIGLGGVIFEFWKDKLIKADILESKSDLYDPIVNIKATAFIYNELYKRKLLKGTKYRDISAMRRYFGGNFESYSERIKSKISEITFSKILR